jgi:hypothetical protein
VAVIQTVPINIIIFSILRNLQFGACYALHAVHSIVEEILRSGIAIELPLFGVGAVVFVDHGIHLFLSLSSDYSYTLH